MAGRGASRVLRIEARAKLNLGLAVGPRRTDGYHELLTVFQSITLADTLVVRRRRRGLSLAVRYEDAAVRRGRPRRVRAVPASRGNLVLRAARLVQQRLGLQGGAQFTLIKRIPVRSGLGGGSADAAAALLGMARVHGRRLSQTDRLALAEEIGSDVPFAALGGTALGRGRGERLTRLRLRRPFRALIAAPSWGISTRAAYDQLDRRKYGLTGWRSHLRFGQHLEREGLTPELALRLGNTFEEVLGDRRSDFLSLCERLVHAGAREPRLTGSGSAVFGILPPGTPSSTVVRRFSGSERLYLVRSARAGVRLATSPHT
ncbi:MAG TPA: 4-(cytidine 5'-diphospho)-2-C-methyl-D-erythritol kinase [Candidatus Limnocylindria bacterium]|nr:4-(cytidine 5'-diphospho)-2-C-methyl-D-erythritol kinase [Candidatus Limnocylindria bacterium]